MKGKHIKNYSKAKAAIRKWGAEKIRDLKAAAKFGREVLADEANWHDGICTYPSTLPPYCYEGHEVTSAQVDGMLAGVADTKEIMDKAYRRLDAADKAAKVVEIEIEIERKPNRTWGSNPTALVRVWAEDGTADDANCYYHAKSSSIGGCGYDKDSTAVQEAFDRLGEGVAVLDRLVVEHGPKLWKEYAVRSSPLPHFEISGKGMGTFECLFPIYGQLKWGTDHPLRRFMLDYGHVGNGKYYHILRRDKV